MPDSNADLRAEMVRNLRDCSPAVAEAMLNVPRHLFLPAEPPERAYADDAIVTKTDQDGHPVSSASQPTLVAMMLDRLGLRDGQRVLEIGAGTGYNAGLIRYLTGPDGTVVTIDIDQDIVDQARANLTIAGYSDVNVICTDGALGHPALAPYDRLVATVGISDLAPAWLDQITGEAVLLVPLDVRGTDLLVSFIRSGGHWMSQTVEPCGFIRMRGALADASRTVTLVGSVRLQAGEPGAGNGNRAVAGTGFDAEALAQAFARPAATVPVVLTAREDPGDPSSCPDPADQLRDFWKFRIWLATTDRRYCTLTEILRPGEPATLANTLAAGVTWAGTIGLVDRASLAVLGRDGDPGAGTGSDAGPDPRSNAGRDPGSDAGSEPGRDAGSGTGRDIRLVAIGYGPDGAVLAADLARLVTQWHETGRPGWSGLHVDAYPRNGADQPPDDGVLMVDRPHTRFAVYRD
jgi:protein-L-isoaspartate(D-aspartate) O-methyltransferase